MARGDSLVRQLELCRILNVEREISVDDLATRLKCAKRTLYRDLHVLERTGWPLTQVPDGKRVRWRIIEDYKRTLNVRLSVQEILALVAAEQLLRSASGTVFASAAHSAVGKLKALLEPPLRLRVEKLSQILSASVGPARNLKKHAQHLDDLIAASEATEVVELTYQKLGASEPERYTVEPHELHMQGSSVYVVAWARERNAARIFLLDRVHHVRRLGEPFKRRPQLPQGAFEQGAFGLWEGEARLVRLRFRGTAARIVSEQKLHPSQRISEEGPDAILLELLVPLSPTLISWVGGFGKRVEVLEPQDLRDAL